MNHLSLRRLLIEFLIPASFCLVCAVGGWVLGNTAGPVRLSSPLAPPHTPVSTQSLQNDACRFRNCQAVIERPAPLRCGEPARISTSITPI